MDDDRNNITIHNLIMFFEDLEAGRADPLMLESMYLNALKSKPNLTRAEFNDRIAGIARRWSAYKNHPELRSLFLRWWIASHPMS